MFIGSYSTNLRNLVADTHTYAQPRLGYEHETEVLEVMSNKCNIPSVDDLLKSLRTPTVQSRKPSEESLTNSEVEPLTSQESVPTKEENVNSNNASFGVMFNRRCSLSDTEILNRQLSSERLWSTNKTFRNGSPCRINSPHRIDSPHRISSPRRIGSPRRSGSCDNFNFRAMKKGSVAEEVLKELQCDSSLVQSSLSNSKNNTDLTDSLFVSGTALNDSLENPVCVEDNANGAWTDPYHGSQDISQNTIGMDNSISSVVSANESSSQVTQEVVERPSILKTSRFGMHKDSFSESFHGSSNKTPKKVRFLDQPSTVEVQTYITKQPSYLSQVPTFQMPISRATPYRSHFSKNHAQTVGSHYSSSNSATFLPRHESTSALSTPVVTKSNISTFVNPSSSNELEKPHNLPSKTPTDEDINNLWSEIRSYFRESTVKPQNGVRLISVEHSNYLAHETDSRFPSTIQRGTTRTHPVTHLSRHKQATPNRADYSDQPQKTDTRNCASPVQITFNDSVLRTKEMKTSGTHVHESCASTIIDLPSFTLTASFFMHCI